MSNQQKVQKEIVRGVFKEDYSDYVLYYIENLSDELKEKIRNRLVEICHGADQAQSESQIYSYRFTVKEFIKQYQSDNKAFEERKKGMIGELLAHVILDIDGRFVCASPFFNMEERSFRKGFDVSLFDKEKSELWIAEVKSGRKQKHQTDASSVAVGLINTAKNDLKKRLKEQNARLWMNAINAAKLSMSSSNNQKEAVVKLLEQYADNTANGNNMSTDYNVVLVGMLFHPISERITPAKIAQKHNRIISENLFNKVFIMATQKETFTAVFDFLESEASNEI